MTQAIRNCPGDYLLNAAAELEDPALLPALLAEPKDDKWAWELATAIEACGGPAADEPEV